VKAGALSPILRARIKELGKRRPRKDLVLAILLSISERKNSFIEFQAACS
jgi:hypothetical protein